MKNPLESIPEPQARRWIIWLAIAAALVWVAGFAVSYYTKHMP